MMKNNTNLVSSAKVYQENQYAEFTTLFRIPFKESDGSVSTSGITPSYIIEAWSEVLISALESRMDALVSILFRNRNNVTYADASVIQFKKSNGQVGYFSHHSFEVMENSLKSLKQRDWRGVIYTAEAAQQMLQALYWIPEDMKKDRCNISFTMLIEELIGRA
jgi:hypothetical protein